MYLKLDESKWYRHTHEWSDRSKGLGRVDVYKGQIEVVEDVMPVAHAHWKPSKEPKHEKEFSRFFVCTNCFHDIQLKQAGIVEDIGFEYCPHCGAKMDEEVEIDEQTAKM